MTNPAPTRFSQAIADKLRKLGAMGPGVVAVSGGADSVALLKALLSEGVPVILAHLNHQLRGAESDDDARFVQSLNPALPQRVHSIDVRAAAQGENLEAKARSLRYDFLLQTAQNFGATWIVTGHTLDDQAETILHRLLRGTGLRGLRGIAERRPLAEGVTLLRPMLEIARDEVIAYLREIGQPWREDSSNQDRSLTRNRIRHEVLPLLCEFNPEAALAFARTASQVADIFPFVEEQAARDLAVALLLSPDSVVVLRTAALKGLPEPRLSELFLHLWEMRAWPGNGMSHDHWQRVAEVARVARRHAIFPVAYGSTRTHVSSALDPPMNYLRESRSIPTGNPNSNPDTIMLRPIRRALLSVSDKTGLVDFARVLHEKYAVELIATGGTKKALVEAGLPVKDVSELTGFPEILDGRVKTLHPAIFAGILAKREKPDHLQTLVDQGLPEIDLVVCNLYPFEQTVAKPGVTEAEAIENIDIGGPSMIRAAAKNYQAVVVLTEPDQYDTLLVNVTSEGTNEGLRAHLAGEAFNRIAAYDRAIADYFTVKIGLPVDGSDFESTIQPTFSKVSSLRYGENPHQKAAFYAEPAILRPSIATSVQVHGKELSYNNILDLDSALNIVREFADPAAVVVKHNNPCGAASAKTLAEAFARAWEGDPQSAFGGILAFNRNVDPRTAALIMDEKAKRFIECVIAPDYESSALEALKGWKQNVRVLKTGELTGGPQGLDYRRVDGGMLVQTRDVGADDRTSWKVATQRQPTQEERDALWFGWLVCKHVKSNAIVLANGTAVVGVGAGQMSRVDSVEIAIRKAGDLVKGSVLASDAFFPFRDNVDAAAKAGVAAIVQPGGSQRDAESIAACDEHGIAMIFTGVRHFRH